MRHIALVISLLSVLVSLASLLFVIHTYHRSATSTPVNSYAKAFCDHYLVRSPGEVRRSISIETLMEQPRFMRSAIRKEMMKRGYRQLSDGCWANDSPHWVDCNSLTGGECSCWRKQCGYERLDSQECDWHK